MAKKNYFHQYLVDNDFWSTFDPNRISGSTSFTGLIHSLTSPLKQTSSFREFENHVKFRGCCNVLGLNLYDIIGATLRTHDTRAVVPFLLFVHPTLDANLN